MSLPILATIVRKDLSLFFKNRYFALITVLGVVAYTAIFYLMPRQVEETLEIGYLSAELPPAFTEALEEEGLILRRFEEEGGLRSAVASGELPAGVIFPEGVLAGVRAGGRPQVDLLISADLPEEFRDLYPILVEEWVALVAGRTLPLEVDEQVLGVDLAGQQIPARQRMLPLLAVFILMIETLGLASLITAEIAAGTIQALLITPLRVEGLFLGKGITGVILAFGQSGALMLATGGLNRQPALVLTTLLLGSAMVTGIAFLIASVSRDFMSVMARGILVVVILAIPAMNVLLPGLTTDWIKALPSYYLAEAVHQVVNFDAGWEGVGGHLLALVGFAALFLILGVVTLRRRFR